MTRPIPMLFFLGVFVLIVAAAALMLATVIDHETPTPDDGGASPRAALALQLALLKQGDWKGLASTFTEQLRPAITEEYVRTRQPVYAAVAIESLVGDVRILEAAGTKTAEVRTPEGAGLGRLLLVDGQWLADTLWFR